MKYWFEKYAMNGKGPFSHVNVSAMVADSKNVRINEWGILKLLSHYPLIKC